MAGILYGIGVGPGDPELVTVKAVRCLGRVACLAAPQAAPQRPSLALTIVKEYLTAQTEILELVFPMTADQTVLKAAQENAARQIIVRLAAGQDVGFITLGDPSLYSTYTYLQRCVKNQGYQTRTIPGVPAMCAAAAQAGIPLAEAEEILVVIPGGADNHAERIQMINSADNAVIMKPSANWEAWRQTLQEQGILEKSVFVQRCGQAGEVIRQGDRLTGEEGTMPVDYMTTIIVKQNGVKE